MTEVLRLAREIDENISKFEKLCKLTDPTNPIITITKHGPLFVRLKVSQHLSFPVIEGFDREPDGNKGELENSGSICAGDSLIQINGITTENLIAEQIRELLDRKVKYKKLVFMKGTLSSPKQKITDVLEEYLKIE